MERVFRSIIRKTQVSMAPIVIFPVVKFLLEISLLTLLFGLGACGVDPDAESRVAVPADMAPTTEEQDDQQPRYNILLILADDLGHDHYGFAGPPGRENPFNRCAVEQVDSLSRSLCIQRLPSDVCDPAYGLAGA